MSLSDPIDPRSEQCPTIHTHTQTQCVLANAIADEYLGQRLLHVGAHIAMLPFKYG